MARWETRRVQQCLSFVQGDRLKERLLITLGASGMSNGHRLKINDIFLGGFRIVTGLLGASSSLCGWSFISCREQEAISVTEQSAV